MSLTEYIIKILDKNQLLRDDIKIYALGINFLIKSFITIITIVIIAIITNSLAKSILFIYSFGYIREYVGGWHAKSYISCYLLTILVYLSFLLLSYLSLTSNILLILSTIVLFLYAPLQHPNNPFDDKHKRYYAKIARKRLIIILFLYLILKLLRISLYISIFYAILFSAILLLIQKFESKRD